MGIAPDLAEDPLTGLSAVEHVSRFAYAGSLRRMCDTVGDIDLLVVSDLPGPVMQAFTELRLVRRVLAQGLTKSSVVTTKGVQVDHTLEAGAPPSAIFDLSEASQAANRAIIALGNACRFGYRPGPSG